MDTYKVVFSLIRYEGSAMVESSDTNNLTTVVQAASPSIAQRMVEAQYGGPSACYVKQVIRS